MVWSWRCSNCNTLNTLSNQCSYCSNQHEGDDDSNEIPERSTPVEEREVNEAYSERSIPNGNPLNPILVRSSSMSELNEQYSQLERRIPADVQQLIYELRNVLPFLGIMFGLFIINHVAGICIYLVSRMIFQQVNSKIMDQVALKNQRNPQIVLMIMIVCIVYVFVIYGIVMDSPVINYLFFMYLPENNTFMNVLWIASMNDVALQLITVFLKAIIILTNLNSIGLGSASGNMMFRNKRKVYSAIELFSLLYRNAIGTPLWYTYYMANTPVYSGYGLSILVMAYTSFKISVLLLQVSAFNEALQRIVSMELAYGSRVTAEELTEEGIADECSICRDNLSEPVKLQCDHVFCAGCVAEWLDRESTCPLCRADIPQAGKIRYSDGSTSMMIQMF